MAATKNRSYVLLYSIGAMFFLCETDN